MMDSKECTKCGHSLPLSSFSKDKGKKDGLYSYCKQCSKNVRRKAYLKSCENPEQVKISNLRQNETRRKNKRLAVEYMGDECLDCKQQFPDSVYDFHHKDTSSKEINPSVVLKLKDMGKIMKELNKCVLLCSNCHRIRHFEKDL